MLKSRLASYVIEKLLNYRIVVMIMRWLAQLSQSNAMGELGDGGGNLCQTSPATWV